MKLVILTNEEFVKNTTSISENVAGKYLLPALQEAQEINLKSILGSTLLEKLKWMVENNAFRGDFGPAQGEDYNPDFSIDHNGPNEHYRVLIDRAQYFLAYTSVAELMAKVTFKVANAGVAQTNDENLRVVSFDDMAKMRTYYQSKADFYALEIQNYLLNNRVFFPELTDGDIHRIHSNLYSAATCGLWLGGHRG